VQFDPGIDLKVMPLSLHAHYKSGGNVGKHSIEQFSLTITTIAGDMRENEQSCMIEASDQSKKKIKQIIEMRNFDYVM
jgi:hypothetical protein